ncbi:MAG: hypothetical protein FJW90_07110 [Actinobacteria bacterium]|nr:hypothetical protein [Actinomycetota bacterium]
MRRNVLIAYGLLQHPLRATIREHLYSFERYGSCRYFYVNFGVRRFPRWLGKVNFDAVILHHTLTGQRMAPPVYNWQLRRAGALRELAPLRVALIQDECIYTDPMSDLIRQFGVQHVFSLAPPSEWPKIYAGVELDEVKFHQVLAGYLDDDALARIERIVAASGEREIDIGYRAWAGLMSLGRQGMLRRQLAEAFGPAAAARGLRTDISTDADSVLHGDDWYRFLASCKYMIGAEGGATVLDRTGEIMVKTERYVASHPGASFEEVEAACFPGEDGKLALFALSPRHLEACATLTCQVLVEGEYSGVLRAEEHYISLKRDLSNIDQVLDRIQDDGERERITEAAYRDVVASGRYSYQRLVDYVESTVGLRRVTPRSAETPTLLRLHRRSVRTDRASMLRMAAYVRAARFARVLGARLLPRGVRERARDRLAGGAKLGRGHANPLP